MNRVRSSLMIVVLCFSAVASAYPPDARWKTSTYGQSIPVYVCIDGFINHFSAPYEKIEQNIRHAINSIFTQGGGDIRLRFVENRSASDPSCQPFNSTWTGGWANLGEVLVVGQIAPNCNSGGMATAPVETISGQGIERATIAVYSGAFGCPGAPCMGNPMCYTPFTWSSTGDFQSGSMEYWGTFQHEFLHTLGLGYTHPDGFNRLQRFVGKDDRDALITNYGTIQTTVQSQTAPFGAPSWTTWADPGQGGFVFGSPSSCQTFNGNSTSRVLIAQTSAVDGRVRTYSRNVTFAKSGSTTSISNDVIHAETAAMRPAIACDGAGRVVLAWIDATSPGNRILTKYSTNHGQTWSTATPVGVSTNWGSAGPISVAYVPWNGHWLLGLTHVQDYQVTNDLFLATSIDQGATFGVKAGVPATKVGGAFGIACRASDGACTLAYPDATQAETPLRTSMVSVDAAGAVSVLSSATHGRPNLGVSIATASTDVTFAFRDATDFLWPYNYEADYIYFDRWTTAGSLTGTTVLWPEAHDSPQLSSILSPGPMNGYTYYWLIKYANNTSRY